MKMKSKIIAAVLTLVVLCLTTDVWFFHKAEVTFFTTAPQGAKITLSYRKKPDSKLLILKQKVSKGGSVSFNLKGRTVSWFKIDLPENAVVQKTVFRGWAKKKLTLSDNEYAGKKLYGRISVIWFKFLTIGILAFWSVMGSISVFQNRNLPKEPEKLPKMMNLEFLRIVFTVIVVWHHFVDNFKIWRAGWLGVEFFFILSGFLLVLTFKPEKTAVSFIKNKWIRFMPLTLYGGALWLVFENKIIGTRLFADVFFYACSGIWKGGGYNNPGWYISVLFVVSLFYFYMMKVFKKDVVNFFVGIIAFFSTVYVVNYDNKFIGVTNGWMLRGLACIGLGYFLAEIYKLLKEKSVVHQRTYNFVELGIFVFAVLNIVVKPWYAGYVVACLAFAGLILMFALRKGAVSNFFEKPVFAKIAKYCLAVYLTHYVICRKILNLLLAKHSDWILSHSAVSIACVLLSVVALGVFAHHVIEKPASKALKEWLG